MLLIRKGTTYDKWKEEDKSSADNGIYMWNVHAGVCN